MRKTEKFQNTSPKNSNSISPVDKKGNPSSQFTPSYIHLIHLKSLAGLASGQRHHVCSPFSLLQSSSEFLFAAVYPETGGVFGIFFRYWARATLNSSRILPFLPDCNIIRTLTVEAVQAMKCRLLHFAGIGKHKESVTWARTGKTAKCVRSRTEGLQQMYSDR